MQNQAASSTESPERPVSPQKAEAKATFRQPASPEPVHEATVLQAPSSPEKPASPERPEAHAARIQATSAVQPDASNSNTVAHQSADISMPSDPVVEQVTHKDAQAAEPRAGDMIVEGKANFSTVMSAMCLLAVAADKGMPETLHLNRFTKLSSRHTQCGCKMRYM